MANSISIRRKLIRYWPRKVKEMSMQIKLPALGEGIDEGQVVSLLVKVGDTVSSGQGLIEVESGKATVEVPAEQAGTVSSIKVKEGDTIHPGDVIAVLETEDGADESQKKKTPPDKQKRVVAPEEKVEPAPPKPEPEPEESAEDGELEKKSSAAKAGLVMATPSVRKLARELGIDARKLNGSGPGGRITEDDVKKAVRAYIGGTGEGAEYDSFGAIHHEKMNAIRLETAKQMANSWQTVPQVTNFDKADVSLLEDARKRLAENGGEKIGITAIIVKALGKSLQKHPKLHALLDLDRREIVYREYVNISVAVDTPRGLLVPVIRNVETKSMQEIQQELAELAGQARAGKLKPEALQGGGFTLSNLGGLGGAWFTPIVNAPQTAILGVGQAKKEFVDVSTLRPMLPLSLSYDHRLVDGADAARFLRTLINMLENPLLALLEGG